MKPKTKALVFNLVCFIAIFLIFRFSLLYLLAGVHHLIVVFIAAIAASVLSPKFFAVSENGKEKLKMKWLFIKGIRDID